MGEQQDTSGGLTGPVARGGKWLFLSQVSVNALLLVRTFVLARVLTKDDYGLWAAIAATLLLMRNLSEAGVNVVAVQDQRGESRDVLMTAWWFAVLRGLLLAIALLALAPMAPALFDKIGARIVPLLRVLSVVFLMEGGVSAGIVVATRNLAFNRLVLVQQGSTFVSIILAIVLGVILQNVMALVVAELVRVVLLLTLSYVILPVRPGLSGRCALDVLWEYELLLCLPRV